MNGRKRFFIYMGLIIMMISAAFLPAAADDDDNGREGEHHGIEREHHEEEGHHQSPLKPVNNTAYQEQCGACHFAYQPELLPSVSWTNIMAGLENHFGETVNMDDDSKKIVSDYLQANSAEKSSSGLAARILQSLGGQIPARITQTPYLHKKHYAIPADAVKRKSIGSLSNCAACHSTAGNGIYSEDNVKIPM